MMEPSPIAACQALWVARKLVKLNKSKAICRVLNPTSKAIKIRKFAIMGQISPVSVIASLSQDIETQPTVDSNTFTTEHKLKLLTEKGICLDETALKRNDRIELTDLTFENLELFATKLADLPGCYVDPLKLDTGDAFPFRARPLRLSPQDRVKAIKQFRKFARRAVRHNKLAHCPKVEVGTRVLLSDPATKKHEARKLKHKFSGPYTVIQKLPNLNSKLMRLSTGMVLARPVHLSRLRLLHELINDYRTDFTLNRLTLMSVFLPKRPTLQMQLILGNLYRLSCDAVLLTDDAPLSTICLLTKTLLIL